MTCFPLSRCVTLAGNVARFGLMTITSLGARRQAAIASMIAVSSVAPVARGQTPRDVLLQKGYTPQGAKIETGGATYEIWLSGGGQPPIALSSDGQWAPAQTRMRLFYMWRLSSNLDESSFSREGLKEMQARSKKVLEVIAPINEALDKIRELTENPLGQWLLHRGDIGKIIKTLESVAKLGGNLEAGARHIDSAAQAFEEDYRIRAAGVATDRSVAFLERGIQELQAFLREGEKFQQLLSDSVAQVNDAVTTAKRLLPFAQDPLDTVRAGLSDIQHEIDATGRGYESLRKTIAQLRTNAEVEARQRQQEMDRFIAALSRPARPSPASRSAITPSGEKAGAAPSARTGRRPRPGSLLHPAAVLALVFVVIVILVGVTAVFIVCFREEASAEGPNSATGFQDQ